MAPWLTLRSILTVGPSIQINGRAQAQLGMDVDLTVGLNYHIGGLGFTYPPSQKIANSGTPAPKDSRTSSRLKSASTSGTNDSLALTLNISPDVSAKGTLSAHLIPSLNFGLSAFDGLVSASVFLDLDTSASLTLDVEGGGNVAGSGGGALAPAPGPTVAPGSGKGTSKASPPAKKTSKTSDKTSTKVPEKTSTKAPVKTTSKAPEKTTTKAPEKISSKKAETSKAPEKTSSKKEESSKAPEKTSKAPEKTSKTPEKTSSKEETSKAPEKTSSHKARALAAPTPVHVGGLVDRDLTINACVDIQAGVAANVGAEGSFFGLFDGQKQVSIFSKNFDLYKVCLSVSRAWRASAADTHSQS
jgi:hypothetical protein